MTVRTAPSRDSVASSNTGQGRLIQSRTFILLIAFLSGIAVTAMEISASRIVAPFVGSSSIVWTNVIGVVLSALKPAEDGEGLVARVLNPTDAAEEATLRWGLPLAGVSAARLDEEPVQDGGGLIRTVEPDTLRLLVPPHALRSVRVRPA